MDPARSQVSTCDKGTDTYLFCLILVPVTPQKVLNKIYISDPITEKFIYYFKLYLKSLLLFVQWYSN